MKWFLGGVAAVNLATSAFVLLYAPHLYDWTWALTDVAVCAVATIPWFAKEPA
jgi:hypothetical protein